jgi:hypothetical protein
MRAMDAKIGALRCGRRRPAGANGLSCLLALVAPIPACFGSNPNYVGVDESSGADESAGTSGSAADAETGASEDSSMDGTGDGDGSTGDGDGTSGGDGDGGTGDGDGSAGDGDGTSGDGDGTSGDGDGTSGDGDGDGTTGDGDGDGTSPACGDDVIVATEFCFTATLIYAGTDVRSVEIGEFDDDQNLDVLVGQKDAAVVLRGGGDGSFPISVALSPGNGEYRAGLAVDLDGDGVEDVVLSRANADELLVYLSTYNGSFAAPTVYDSGDDPRALVAVSLDDGDGFTDVMTADWSGDTFTAHRGDGTMGLMVPGVASATGNEPAAITQALLDGDGLADLVLGTATGDAVEVHIQQAGGTWSQTAYSIGAKVHALGVADFDGAGGLDVVVTAEETEELRLMTNDGSGSLTLVPGATAVGQQPRSMVVGDFDSDGASDVLVSNEALDRTVFVRGGGDGSFAAAVEVLPLSSLLDTPIVMDAGDLNEDGVLDAVIGGSHGVAVLISNP